MSILAGSTQDKSARGIAKAPARLARWIAERRYGAYDCQTHIIAIHDRKLLYFAVPKAANTSLKALFSDHIEKSLPDPLRERMPRETAGGTLFRKDRRALMYDEGILLCKHQAERLVDYTGFALVRNPWDRVVSCYANKLTRGQLAKGPRNRGTLKSLERAGAFSTDLDFAGFVEAVSKIPDEHANRHFRSQFTFLTDRTGALMPSRILKFESLTDELNELLSEYGLDELRLPHKKPTRRADYREYYDEHLKELVAERYARDIELFGYRF